MAGKTRGDPLDYHPKEWDSVFAKDRNFKEDGSHVERRRGIRADGDDLAIFLQDFEDSTPSCEVEEVGEFCRDARLDDLRLGAGTAGLRRAAWLDDRSCPRRASSAQARDYRNPLTAYELYKLLKEPVGIAP
jgi:hypothetical protein